MNKLLAALVASVMAAVSATAIAQSASGAPATPSTPAAAAPAAAPAAPAASTGDAKKDAAKKKRDDFKARQSTLEAQSRSSASGAVQTDPKMATDKVVRSGDKKKDFAAGNAAMQAESKSTASGSGKVDKSQTAANPVDRKTKGAGAAAVKEMGKDSKP